MLIVLSGKVAALRAPGTPFRISWGFSRPFEQPWVGSNNPAILDRWACFGCLYVRRSRRSPLSKRAAEPESED